MATAALYKAILINTGGRWIRHAPGAPLPLKEVNALCKELNSKLTERQKKQHGYRWLKRNINHHITISEERNGKFYFKKFCS